MQKLLKCVIPAFIVAFVLAFAGKCLAAPQPHTVLYVDQVISRFTMRPVTDALRKVVNKGQDTNIDIVIDSPGGEVVAGMEFVNLMATARGQGSKITCYVVDVAASMAFQIFTQCDKRYALPGSLMLWHGVRIQTNAPITATLAGQLRRSLEEIDDLIKYQLYSTVNMPKYKVNQAFEDELLWTGVSLQEASPKFLTIKTDYSELYPEAKKGVHMATSPLEFLFGGQIMYLWQGYAP